MIRHQWDDGSGLTNQIQLSEILVADIPNRRRVTSWSFYNPTKPSLIIIIN